MQPGEEAAVAAAMDAAYMAESARQHAGQAVHDEGPQVQPQGPLQPLPPGEVTAPLLVQVVPPEPLPPAA